jgi:HEAT repeat protein
VLADAAAREAVKAAKDDPAPAVKAAALLASVPPGAGRAAVFKVIPFLKETSAEVRAAATAAVVRAAGDAELGQLYKLFTEKDAVVYELVAAELGRYTTAATGELLLKIVKREDKRVRIAATKALIARSDPPSRAAVEGLAKDPDPDVRLVVLLATAPDQAAQQAATADATLARNIYRALVGKPQYRATFLDWLLAKYRGLDAKAKAEVLAEWLAGAPAQR